MKIDSTRSALVTHHDVRAARQQLSRVITDRGSPDPISAITDCFIADSSLVPFACSTGRGPAAIKPLNDALGSALSYHLFLILQGLKGNVNDNPIY